MFVFQSEWSCVVVSTAAPRLRSLSPSGYSGFVYIKNLRNRGATCLGVIRFISLSSDHGEVNLVSIKCIESDLAKPNYYIYFVSEPK